MNRVSKIIYFIVSIVFFIIFNLQISNLIINSANSVPENIFFDLTLVKNTGAAFNILENSTLFLIIFAIFSIMCIIVYSIKNIEKFSLFAWFWTAMLLSGISCNMFERIHFGYVRDFFMLKCMEFPIFNLSDIFINISVFALIIIIVKNKYLRM